MYPYKHQLLTNTEVKDGELRFALSDNRESFPWRCLPFHHPALAGKLSFFTGIACGELLFKMTPDVASALTRLRWRTHVFDGGWPWGGTLRARKSEGRFGYESDFYNGDGKLAQRLEAEGVVFLHRDFEQWRREAKQHTGGAAGVGFSFAEPLHVGATKREECFVTPLRGTGDELKCDALLDARSGFVPVHPWHTGTGDHVNAGHLLDAVWQTAHLVGTRQGWWAAPARLVCLGGEASFRRFVELGSPFEIALSASSAQGGQRELKFQLSQQQAVCSAVALALAVEA